MCFNLYYKLNLINKFIKHNQLNNSCCDIKYLDLPHNQLNILYSQEKSYFFNVE